MKREFVWYVIIVLLISEPIAELARYVVVAYQAGLLTFSVTALELGLMWTAFLTGIVLMAWRLSQRVGTDSN